LEISQLRRSSQHQQFNRSEFVAAAGSFAEMNTILGLVVALALLGSGVWANIGDGGTLALMSRGTWVARY
jgi:hypothetical protein